MILNYIKRRDVVEMFNDIIPRSNCIRLEIVHMPKIIISYFMKSVVIGTSLVRLYKRLRIGGSLIFVVRQSHVIQNLTHL